ncbi:MAG: acetyl-CoA acetyltransferase [Alphaproteobacteria bacterium]
MDPRTPVLVGIGTVLQREEDPAASLEAIDLVVAAARRAGEDAGAPGLLARVDLVAVPRGVWSYADPGRMVADALGARARSLVAEIGVLQQSVISRACRDLAEGRSEVALVCGGEAKHRSLRAMQSGTSAPERESGATLPDESMQADGDVLHPVEISRHLAVPAHQYAVIESALRHAASRSPASHRAHLGELWHRFAQVAAGSPDAWERSAPAAAEIAAPGGRNRLVAAPYTRMLCSQWNVDQAAALLLTTFERARAADVPRDRMVFPLAAVESNLMVPLVARAELHRWPAFREAARRLAELVPPTAPAGLADERDLYSCFPAAVQVQASELGLPLDAPLTVTGGMTFGGGPLNSFVLQSTAAMARRLRDRPGARGLVTCVSGMLTKPALALWSTEPRDAGFACDDVTVAARAATATLAVDPEAVGSGTVVGATALPEGGELARAVAIVELDDGRRTVASAEDAQLARSFAEEEPVGSRVRVGEPGRLG